MIWISKTGRCVLSALWGCRSDRTPQTRHAAYPEKHDAVEKGEDGEQRCLKWQRDRDPFTLESATHMHRAGHSLREEKEEGGQAGTT